MSLRWSSHLYKVCGFASGGKSREQPTREGRRRARWWLRVALARGGGNCLGSIGGSTDISVTWDIYVSLWSPSSGVQTLQSVSYEEATTYGSAVLAAIEPYLGLGTDCSAGRRPLKARMICRERAADNLGYWCSSGSFIRHGNPSVVCTGTREPDGNRPQDCSLHGLVPSATLLVQGNEYSLTRHADSVRNVVKT